MYPCSCFLMYYLSCFVAPLLLLLNNSWAAPHFCLCVCIWVCLLIGALPLLIAAQPRLLTDPLSCHRSSKGRWWWWEGMLSLTSAHLYPFQVQPEPTDSTSPLISVQLPLCLQHTDMHAHIYKYLYSAQMSCQHGPVGCAAPPTVYSRSFNRSVVQHLTFSLFFFFFFFVLMTHHVGPTVTLDSVYISQPKPTPTAGVNLWHYSVPIELKEDCQGTKTAGSWDSSGSHFGPIGSGQRTFVGGDWEVSKWVSSILLWIRFHPSRGEGCGEWVTLAGSDVTQARPIADRHTRLDPCPRTCSAPLDPSLAVAAEMDTKQF